MPECPPVKLVRLAAGRDEQPSQTIIDSQSVKTVEKSAPPAPRSPRRKDGASRGLEQGIDGHKQVKGRKRHIVVDTLGLVLNCFVSAANMADVRAATVVLEPVL